MPTIAIDSEEIAWQILDRVVRRELSTDDLLLDFTNADWARFRVVYKGKNFHNSLPTSAMRGLVEYQYSLYRSVALLLRDSLSAASLTDDEKQEYEAVFNFSEGSTESENEGKGFLDKLYNEAIKKMSGRQLTICVLAFAVLAYGDGMYAKHLKSVADSEQHQERQASTAQGTLRDAQAAARDDAAQQATRAMIAADIEKTRILERALKVSQKASVIEEENSRALDAILKNTSDAEYVVLQGRKINRQNIIKHNKQTRRKSLSIQIDRRYIVVGVDATGTDSYRLRVRDADNAEEIDVAFEDPIIVQKNKRVIERALFTGNETRLIIAARKKGQEIYAAELIRAYAVSN